MSTHSLYKWMKLFAEPAPKMPNVDHESENRRLKRELARTTEERDILKKGELWIVIGSSPMATAFIRAHREEFGVRAMCRVLRVHFSGFYGWLKEPLSRRAQNDARQTALIRQAWSESGKVCGDVLPNTPSAVVRVSALRSGARAGVMR